jgi:phosphoribosylglycinamide formyltransferase-1
MDEGKIIMQTADAVDPSVSAGELRHRLFVQQCKALLQVTHWLSEGRISVDDRRVMVRDAQFKGAGFSPALEFTEAQTLHERIPTFGKQETGGTR